MRKYLFDGESIPRQLAGEIMLKSADCFADKGYGLWAVARRGTERVIGACGYWFFHEPPELELLYLVSEPEWGQGIAAEAARAVMEYGFTTLAFERIQASTDAPNVASVRVMEKLGMSFWKREAKEGLDTIFYAITKADFAR